AGAAMKSANALEATTRPFLHIVLDSAGLAEAVEIADKVIGTPEAADKRVRLWVRYAFKNYGRVPAIIKEQSHAITTSLPDAPTYSPLQTAEREYAVEAGGVTPTREC